MSIFAAPTSAPAAAAPGALFGAAPAAAMTFPTLGSTLGTVGGFGVPAGATATTSVNLFGKPAPTVSFAAPAAAAPTGFAIPTVAAVAAAAAAAASPAPPAAAVVPATTVAAPKVGLGGINPETSRAGSAAPGAAAGSEAAKTNELQSLKEQEIPTLLKTEVTGFKDHIKKIKTVREDIARFSAKPFHKVLEDVNSMSKLLNELGNNLHKNVTKVEKLRFDTHRELKNAEIALRTKDTPPGLQYENMAPMGYFQYMVDDFEVRMQTYRQQIEQLESYLAASSGVQATPLSPQTLASLIQQIQDSFMEIAGQLQVVHEKIQTQKEHYLNYRKFILDDDSDVFASGGVKKPARGLGRGGHASLAATGPAPFGSTFAQKSTMASIFAALQATQAPTSTTPQVSAPTAVGGLSFVPSVASGGAPPTLALGATKLPQTQSTFAGVGTNPLANVSTLNASASTGFGVPSLSQTSFNSAGTLFGANPATVPAPLPFGTTAATPLTLAKPPMGNKRGKR